MTNDPPRASIPTPSLGLLSVEPMRALLEYASLHFMDKSGLPRGRGEPVVIFPGLGCDPSSVAPLKSFCESLGYTVHDWGRGLNTGPEGEVDAWLEALAQDMRRLAAAHSQPLCLIGWSLGGIYARELAKRMPGQVSQVITIGTPAADLERTHASWAYRLVHGPDKGIDRRAAAQLRAAPDVPVTSIYSRSDGIVAWQACVQDGPGQRVENIEVDGSHVGMGWNPQVLSIIARKLQQAQ